ncbi:MAG: DUF4296 domain-containing protein [Bacteroidota bacterium]
MRFYIFILLLTCWACSDSKPSNRLSEDQMAEILADIHLDEGKISSLNIVSADTSVILYNQLERATLKRHGVDSTQFAKSFASYVQEPQDFIDLYKKVNAALAKKQRLKK